MPVGRFIGPICCVQDCLRPARELGGICTSHWQGLSPLERAYLQWEASLGDTEPIDSVAVRECVVLEDLFGLPAREPKRAA